jgi:hypothetical protein
MSQQVVQDGPFGGCTLAQLNQIRLDFTGKALGSNDGLIGASINGQSYQFTAPSGQTYTRAEYWDQIKWAYNQLGVTQYGTPGGNSSVSCF